MDGDESLGRRGCDDLRSESQQAVASSRLDRLPWRRAVLGSLFMAWYQLALSGSGVSVAISVTTLASPAGGLWRWLMLVFSIAVLFEVALSWLVLSGISGIEWPHRSVLVMLCLADMALVIGSMVASRFGGETVGRLSASLGSGAYVALAGAILAAAASVARLFTGPPALAA
ncbi:MAG: hypothetical protein ACYCST_14110 [Acidimicrobiales bacterium]